MAQKIEIIIPEDTSVKDFAYAVASILKEDYGQHNYKVFMDVLTYELLSSFDHSHIVNPDIID